MIRCTVNVPTAKIGKVICKHDCGRWYELSLFIDDELVQNMAHWCLDQSQFGNQVIVASDILSAFGLHNGAYAISEPYFRDLHCLVKRGEDFTVDIWQHAIVS